MYATYGLGSWLLGGWFWVNLHKKETAVNKHQHLLSSKVKLTVLLSSMWGPWVTTDWTAVGSLKVTKPNPLSREQDHVNRQPMPCAKDKDTARCSQHRCQNLPGPLGNWILHDNTVRDLSPLFKVGFQSDCRVWKKNKLQTLSDFSHLRLAYLAMFPSLVRRQRSFCLTEIYST